MLTWTDGLGKGVSVGFPEEEKGGAIFESLVVGEKGKREYGFSWSDSIWEIPLVSLKKKGGATFSL